MMTLHQNPTLRRSLCGVAVLLFVAVLSQTGYSEQKTISPEKAKLIGYVEDFLMNNFRDVTMRKSLEWSDVKTDDKGNSTIRYRCEALIWDKDRMTLAWDFTFDKDGKYVSHNKIESTPVKVEKPDITTAAGVKRLVEKFFSENFRDITARKTLKWGDLVKNEDGGVSITYRYEATIWDKDKIINEQKFTFDKDGKYVGHETLNKKPVKKNTEKTDTNSAKQKIADQYFEYLIAKDFSKANKMGNEEFKKGRAKIKDGWENIVNEYGNFEKCNSTVSQNIKEGTKSGTVFDKECLFEKATVMFRIAVDENDKITGFFMVSSKPNALPTDIGKEEPMVEKPISEKPFKVKEIKADSETTETFTVTIHAKIRKKDKRAFDTRYLECQFEIIDAVTTALQGSTSDDRRSVGLTNIKKKVKKAINDVLGTPYIQEILTQDPILESQ